MEIQRKAGWAVLLFRRISLPACLQNGEFLLLPTANVHDAHNITHRKVGQQETSGERLRTHKERQFPENKQFTNMRGSSGRDGEVQESVELAASHICCIHGV